MFAFLHRLALSGTRTVPARGRVKVRAVEGQSQAAMRGEAGERRGPQPRPDLNGDVSLPPPAAPTAVRSGDVPPSQPVTIVTAVPPPPTPLAEPSLLIGGRGPSVETEPAERVRPDVAPATAAAPPLPAAAAEPQPQVVPARRSAPLPRVPLLSVEGPRADIVPGESNVSPRPAPPAAAVDVDLPPPAEFASEPMPPVRGIRGFEARVPAGRQLPLPELNVPDRPSAPPTRPKPPAPITQAPVAARPDTRERVKTVVVEPSPAATSQASAARPAVRDAAGLTIHKLELQIVERPRELPPEPPDADAAASAESYAWDWSDRRYATRVW